MTGTPDDPQNPNPPADPTPPTNPNPPADPTPPANPPADPTPPADPNNPPADPTPPAPAEAWADLDDELKGFVGDKSPADVAKELQAAQTLIGKKVVGIPDKDATPEEHKAFHTARGVPEAADGYDFTAIKDEMLKDIPEADRDAAWDSDEENYWRETFKKSNISQGEAAELFQRGLADRTEKAQAAQAEAVKVDQATTDLITQHWGNKEKEYSQDANNWARANGLGDDAMDALRKLAGTSADTRFQLADMMRKQGEMLREGGKPGDLPGNTLTPAGMTKEQAEVAKAQYIAIPDNAAAYNDSNHARYAEVSKQMGEFGKIIRGIKE